MKYLSIIFIPPLYFMMRGKWGGFFLNSILYGLAVLCVLSLVGMVVAPVFWLLAVGHASWHLRSEVMGEQADLIATKLAEKLGHNPKPPEVP